MEFSRFYRFSFQVITPKQSKNSKVDNYYFQYREIFTLRYGTTDVLQIQKGVVAFQAVVRGFAARRQYERTLVMNQEQSNQAAIVLQSWFRMMRCVQLLRTLKLIQFETGTNEFQLNHSNENAVLELGDRQRGTYKRTSQAGGCSPGCNCSIQ